MGAERVEKLSLAGESNTAVDLEAVLEHAQRLLADGDADGARRELERARAGCRQAGDRATEANALRLLGDLEWTQGRHPRALQHWERAQTMWHELGDAVREADTLLSVGDARRALDRAAKASEAYRAAGALYETLDDPLGQGHAAFRLGELSASAAPDRARQEFTRAAAFYDAADRRVWSGGLRISDPHLPDHVKDPRAIEPWIMAKVVERETAKLQRQPEPEKTQATANPATASGRAQADAKPPGTHRRELIAAGVILASVSLGFVVLVVLAAYAPASVQAEKVIFGLVGLVAASISWLMVRAADIQSKPLRHAIPVAVAVLVYSGGLLFFMSHRHAVNQERVWNGIVAAPVDLTAPAAGAPAHDSGTARRAYADTLALYERQGNRMGQADVLLASAQLEQSLYQHDQALLFYSRSYALYRDIGALGPAAQIAITMGDTLRTREQFAPAREQYANAAGLYQQLHDTDALVSTLRKRGDAERALGHLDAARDTYLQALALANQQNNGDSRLALLLRVGRVEAAAAQSERARQAFTQALTLAQERGDLAGQARVWLATAQLETDLGRPEAANAAFDKAAELANTARDPRLEARLWRLRGDIQRGGALDVARQDYALALQIAQQGKTPADEARALLRLAAVDAQLRDADAARAEYTQSLAIYEQLAQPVGRAHATVGIGDVEAMLGRTQQAADAYGRARDLYAQAGNRTGQIATLERLARVTSAANPHQAREYEAQAAVLRKDVGGSSKDS
jgi:tetratricopeptide (TPR) repeat protein